MSNALVRMLELREKRQAEALAETKAQLAAARELEAVKAKQK